MRRVALAAICVALFVLLGIVVPYRAYNHFPAKQNVAGAVVVHEEL